MLQNKNQNDLQDELRRKTERGALLKKAVDTLRDVEERLSNTVDVKNAEDSLKNL